MKLQKLLSCLIPAALPLTLFAFAGGPPIKRTSAPGEVNCTACHRGNDLNSPGGRVSLDITTYRPGQKQTIRVTVEHPTATRWGFELTARVGESGIPAGVFAVNDNIRVRCDDGSLLGSASPCADNVQQFVTHTSNSTMPGKTGNQTWDIEWTPPSEEVGDIVFYVAGNAANNSNTNVGDFIYTNSVRVSSDAPCGLTTKPTLVSIGNAATSQGAISSNALISLYGRNFALSGTRRIAGPGDIRSGSFGNELRCVTVEVAGVRAPVTFVQNDQINAQMPTITTTGSIPVRVIINAGKPNEIASDTATITVQNYSPAFLTFNGTSVAALHPDFSIAANPAVVASGRPVRPGDIVLLYGTGFGPSEPVYRAGEIVPLGQVPLRDRPTVIIGGVTLTAADILYAGIAPGSISGLYQLNVRVPATATTGNVPVSIGVGGITSPTGATIPVQAPQP